MPVADDDEDTYRIALLARIAALGRILARIGPLPEEWTKGGQNGPNMSDSAQCTELIDCRTFKELVKAWRKVVKPWPHAYENTLTVMLAVAASTQAQGEQLWVKINSPPSSGKTTLAEGLELNERFTISKSSMRGFYSGYDSGDGTDHSLALKVQGKTLITKDGDSLVKAPNLPQILSEARDLYDGRGNTSYRHGGDRSYKNLRFTWILCGTSSSLREIDSSELGARFLDCVMTDRVNPDNERSASINAALQELRNVTRDVGDETTIQRSPEHTIALQMTGGYLDYLRCNATQLADAIHKPTENSSTIKFISSLALYTAHLRARPGLKGENTERELCYRLTKQFTRLAVYVAVVLNRTKIDQDVLKVVKKVALDTSRGFSHDLIEHVRKEPKGRSYDSLAMLCNKREDETKAMIRFLKDIDVLESNLVKTKGGMQVDRHRFVLTKNFTKLYKEVHR